MEKKSKKEALRKLQYLRVKLGYPDKWINYSKLTVKDDAFVLNVIRARSFNINRVLKEIDKPVDRSRWFFPPQTVNAYYSPQQNEIAFPAGILQPIMFDPKADEAVNFGAIGTVIAHELTHGFDDQGRKFDSRGNLRDWWSRRDAANFNKRSQKVIRQFESYPVIDGLHLNGRLTLGENIADLGGISVSLLALKARLKSKRLGKIDGLNPLQRFFLSYAQVWKSKIRPQYLRVMLMIDPHPPAWLRVNGPLGNFDEFAEAFSLKPGSPMILPAAQRSIIW